MELHGITVSTGIAIGKVYIYRRVQSVQEKEHFTGDAQPAWEALLSAKEKVLADLDTLIAQLSGKSIKHGEIFQAHKELLIDDEIWDALKEAVFDEKMLPESAVAMVFESFAQLLSQTEDALIAARCDDLRDLSNRMTAALRGATHFMDAQRFEEPVILVAYDLLPSDTAQLDHGKVLGIITETGGATSHTAILANSLGIPAILGVENALTLLKKDETIAMDAIAGIVHTEPDAEKISELSRQRSRYIEKREQKNNEACNPCKLADGTKVEIGLNIGSTEWQAAYAHCDFVGLLRSEFLYMRGRALPTEDEQLAAYRQVLHNAGGRSVTLRTLDIGGDKTLPYMELPREDNPFLGKRALRLCFDEPGIFHTQLRAALRASAEGPLQVMFPMVSSMDDIYRAKAALASAKEDLRKSNLSFNDNMPVGIMVEIPALAMIADLAAEEGDFASIGTNDLCQYTCAVDRVNPFGSDYYSVLSPAMLRILSMVVKGFSARGKSVSVCGEMGGDPLGILALVGMGVRKLSMSPARIGAAKAILSRVSGAQLQALADRLMQMPTQEKIIDELRRIAAQ